MNERQRQRKCISKMRFQGERESKAEREQSGGGREGRTERGQGGGRGTRCGSHQGCAQQRAPVSREKTSTTLQHDRGGGGADSAQHLSSINSPVLSEFLNGVKVSG